MRLLSVWCALAAVLFTSTLVAAPIGLSDSPLYYLDGVAPNVILTMDDSGSMAWSYMPDGIVGKINTKRAKSSSYNKVYYDPDVTYPVPVDDKGEGLQPSSFTSAWNDGFDQSSCRINLSTSFRPTWSDGNNCDSKVTSSEYAGAAAPAYYYRYVSTNNSCSGIEDEDCYSKVNVSSTSGPGGTDERVNFANWYSYYRTRMLASKSAAAIAFSNIGSGFRVAHQTINPTRNADKLTKVTPFTTTERTAFYNWLFNVTPVGGTPLRRAMSDVGQYLSTAAPYTDDPSVAGGVEISCRQNFHVMITDGYWNDAAGVTGNIDGTPIAIPENKLNVTQYSKQRPYTDTKSSTLADNAFNYWVKDLRPDLVNNVPTSIVDISTDFNGDGQIDDTDLFFNPKNDPASWQHMVNYMVGLGVEGTLSYPDDLPALVSGAKAWGADEIDDLWHSAINSRGNYFSAANAEQLNASLASVADMIIGKIGSSAPVALNSGVLNNSTFLFQAVFDTAGWNGHLIASKISDGQNCGLVEPGEVCSTEWDASCILNGGDCVATNSVVSAQSSRAILSFNGTIGVAFDYDNLSSAQKTSLRDPDGAQGPKPAKDDVYGKAVVAFVRGSHANELSRNGVFRNRASILGDIINSAPVHVDPPNKLYGSASVSSLPEAASYDAFATANKSRSNMVYIGGNDGIFHGFKADTGEEVFGYVPGRVTANLWSLTAPNYEHTSYVDGDLTVDDVYYDGAWHTVVVGSLGRGGKGYFALDVTKPDSIGEATAASTVLWEFTEKDDIDLGFTYSKPSISRMANGQWVAIFGNGYNNTVTDNGHAGSTKGYGAIYVVDIKTGQLIKKFNTRRGLNNDPSGLNRPNGINAFSPVDLNGDFVVDAIYAGDLFGHVWAIDVSSADPSAWGFKYGLASAPTPLYTTKNSAGESQPITYSLTVARHPSKDGVMVYVGTGKYLGVEDIADLTSQSVYGVWDNGSAITSGLSRFLEQTITTVDAQQFTGLKARVVSNKKIIWDDGIAPAQSDEKLGWYIVLPELGEKTHQRIIVRNGRLIFVTIVPSGNPCESGGYSWLMEVDMADGSRLDDTPFDYNRDGSFSSADFISVNFDVNGDGEINEQDKLPGSGISVYDTGVYTTPSIMIGGQLEGEIKLLSTSNTRVLSIRESSPINKTRSWREIR